MGGGTTECWKEILGVPTANHHSPDFPSPWNFQTAVSTAFSDFFCAWVQFCCGEMSSALPLVSLQREDIPYSKARMSKCRGYGERPVSIGTSRKKSSSLDSRKCWHTWEGRRDLKDLHHAQLSCGEGRKRLCWESGQPAPCDSHHVKG